MSFEAPSDNQPLLQEPEGLPAAHPATPMSCRLKQTAALLLLIKLCSTTFEYQMVAYNVELQTHSGANESATCKHRRQPQNCMSSLACTASAVVAYAMPALGGALSDVLLGCLPTLWLGTAIHAAGSCLLTAMDHLDIICLLPIYLLTWATVLLYLSMNDAVLIHALFRLAHHSGNRQVLTYLYSAAAAAGETLGSVPTLLSLHQSRSFKIICMLFGILHVVCMPQLATSAPRTASVRFEMPRLRQLRRFYLITAGTILPLSCMMMCRLSLYWSQIRFFTRAEINDAVLAYYVPFAGYQTAMILLCLFGAGAVCKFGIPAWFSLIIRIRTGLGLGAASKLPLVVLSLLDYRGTISMESWRPFSIWLIYFALSFMDGASNALTTVAIYEVAYSIANKNAKATMVGIFYTVWSLAVLLSATLMSFLLSAGIVILDSSDGHQTKPMVHSAYAMIIALHLIAMVYWEKISWPLASGLLPTDAELDEQFREIHDDSFNADE